MSAAVAFISPPLVLLAEPQSPAHLVAGGAALDVTVDYTCAADSMFIDIQATEKVGKRLASGYGFVSVPCDGATHTTTVRLTANGTAFAKGTAAIRLSVSGCSQDFTVCGNDTINRTIAVTK
jgi:hypothetical protein